MPPRLAVDNVVGVDRAQHGEVVARIKRRPEGHQQCDIYETNYFYKSRVGGKKEMLLKNLI